MAKIYKHLTTRERAVVMIMCDDLGSTGYIARPVLRLVFETASYCTEYEK